jgi:hypothetical protein
MTAPKITAEELTHMRRDVVDELDALRGGDGLSRKFARIAQRLLAELDRLSAQGGEVPEIGDKVRATMNRTDWFEGVFKERSEVFAEFGVEVPGLGLRFFIHAEKIPAPPHPDTVEVSREDYEYLQLCEAVATTKPRVGCEDFALRWNTWVAAANLMWELVAKRDALRAQAQSTTNETRG